MCYKLFKQTCLIFGMVMIVSLTGCEKELDYIYDELKPGKDDEHSSKAMRESSDVATDWYNLQAEIILQTAPQLSPVVTGRFFSYEGIVLYETVRYGIPKAVSLSSLLYQMPQMPDKEKNNGYSWSIAANAAMAYYTRHMFTNLTEDNLASIKSLEDSYNNTLKPNQNSAVALRSREFGRAVAAAVIAWAATDGVSRNTEAYTPPVFPGAWVPTPPNFAPAGFPYMGSYRPFLEEHLEGVVPAYPYPYSEEPGSPFYNEVYYTYEASKNATDEQKAIASFWHNAGPGTYTALAHHYKILTAVLEETESSLGTAAMAYARAGIATRDGLIMTWRSKYFYNLVRPVTYIQKHIDPNWLPYLGATPSYPEYPAAHTVITTAFMEVMTGMFGENYEYTDKTYEFRGVVRSYDSFRDAATEAGWSRIYGGIHYRPAVEAGKILGEEIGHNVMQLKLQR
ncbi:phosphatase PAP2 family protein [Pontibacter pamirensis]|uniref:phosphatase PAP2 family protein n=1 Tax=Pontibacter pamirensis TaxID=2562824 RepID=UPI0013894D82|nr:phosphatase PAP2 family protein [Pontibacter pamirensis]